MQRWRRPAGLIAAAKRLRWLARAPRAACATRWPRFFPPLRPPDLTWSAMPKRATSATCAASASASTVSPTGPAAASSSASMQAMRSASFSVLSFSRRNSTTSGKASGEGASARAGRAAARPARPACRPAGGRPAPASAPPARPARAAGWPGRACGGPRRSRLDDACNWRVLLRAPGQPWKISPATRAISRKRRSDSSPAFRLPSTSAARSRWRSSASTSGSQCAQSSGAEASSSSP